MDTETKTFIDQLLKMERKLAAVKRSAKAARARADATKNMVGGPPAARAAADLSFAEAAVEADIRELAGRIDARELALIKAAAEKGN